MRPAGVAICQPNRVLPVNEQDTQVDSTASLAICLKGFEDRRILPRSVSVMLRQRPPSAVRDRIFDNKVERASRESSLEL